MADKYYRLVCFVTNICCQPLRKLFIKLAEADATHKFTNLQSYLRLRQQQIDRLNLRYDQYFLLFPTSGVPNETTWDVTLLVFLIDKLFQIQPLVKYLLEEIRTIRNILQHVSNTDILSDAKFDEYWHRLESATVALAKEVDGAPYETDIKRQISEGKITHMPNLGDTLRIFYEENTRQMTHKIASLETTIDELHTKLDSIAANSNETSSLLDNVTATKIGSMGEKVKRFKIVDEILCRLKKRLYATMKTELPENFTPPAEIANVRTKLRDSHHVIIAGSGNSLNLATALFIINEFEYNHNRCVEMTSASEWRHIDPEDVDLVLCRDQFGKPLYDARKASCMVDIFDSIHHAVRPRDGSKHLDFIMVTDVDCLTELKANTEHDLLEEVVLLSTSEEQPVDLTIATYQWTKQTGHELDFTKYIAETKFDSYSKNASSIDQVKLEEARNALRRHGMVAITGPPKFGKTSAALALAKSYKSEEIMFLRTPGDIRKINPRTTLLVIIEDFGGKYLFDKIKVNEWFTDLDDLLESVTAGRLQVIVTGDTEKLQRCIREIAPHPFLLNPVNLTRNPVYIKQETAEKNNIFDCNHSVPSNNALRLQVVQSVQSVRQYRVRIDSDEASCNIRGCCMLPGGEILLADGMNSRLKKLDSGYNVISVCDLPGNLHGVCYIGNNVAVVTVYKQLVYVDVSSMTVRNTVTTDHWFASITCHNDKLYVKSDDTVYMYTLDGKNRWTLYKFQNKSFDTTGIAVSGDGKRIYIADGNTRLITIYNFGNLLNSLTLPVARAVCVDDRGNVWVCGMFNKKLYQVSADGARLLGTVSVDELNGTLVLCYDRDRSSLIVAEINDNIHVIRLD